MRQATEERMRGTEALLQNTPHLHFSWRERENEGERERDPVCANLLFSSSDREERAREVIFQESKESHKRVTEREKRGEKNIQTREAFAKERLTANEDKQKRQGEM